MIPATVNAIAPMMQPDDGQGDEGSVPAASALGTMERIFVEAFVANGGKGKEAAIAAGIDDDKAAVQACRWLCRKRIADYLTHLAERFAHTALPIAIKALIDIASDETALRKDRIKAATSLLEHGGMAAPKGGVSVQVGLQVNGSQAQAIISSVHEARAARLSDIPPAMPDTLHSDLRMIEGTVERLAGDPPGGDEAVGPAAGSCPLPASPSPKPVKSPVSCECEDCRAKESPDDARSTEVERDDRDPFAAFRTDEGEDDAED